MKVLIISHNAISTYNNMGKTLQSLFSSFSKEELCQLYVYPSIPDVDYCNSFFRVTDKEALKSVAFRYDIGSVIDKKLINNNSHHPFEHEKDEKIYTKKNNHSHLKRLLRDFIWVFSKWNNATLWRWLDEESPTCIFLAPGYAKFIYDIALTIARRMRIPIVTYICDDYYFVKDSSTAVGKIQQLLLRKKMDELLNKSLHIFVICDELKCLYQKKYNSPVTTIMTGSKISPIKKGYDGNSRKFCFFGNIDANRSESLCDIGQVLEKINQETKASHILNIFTAEKDSNLLKSLERYSSIRIKPFLTGDDFTQEFFSADCLVHVEGFSSTSIDKVKYSISTKIPDSLASGIPLLAYGPIEVASIQHLIKNNCAFVSTDKTTLRDLIQDYLENESMRVEILRNANLVAQTQHNERNNSFRIKKILEVLNSCKLQYVNVQKVENKNVHLFH